MKTRYIFFAIIVITSLVAIGESNSIYAQIYSAGGMPIILLFTPKSSFVDGEIIPITGHALRNSTITISLADNYGNVENSTEVKSNSTGYFSTSLSIPLHVIGGAWYIFATSDENHSAIKIMVNVHGVSTMSLDFPSELSPLKQFNLGIKAKDVTCKEGLYLIIKAEDGSPACVTIKAGIKIALRDNWATTFGTGVTINDYNISCNTTYPRSDSGIAVLYMPTNSVGKVCVKYYNFNNTPTIVGDRIFDANNITNNASDVTTWASTNTLQGNDNATIVYTIKTGNKTGFYGLSLTCGGVPLAVGYGANSTITTNDFPWANQVFHCGVIKYDYYIEGTKGIEVRYIPYP